MKKNMVKQKEIKVTIPKNLESAIGKPVKFENKIIGKVTGYSDGKAELEIYPSLIPLKNQNITMSYKCEKKPMTWEEASAIEVGLRKW
jgi:hypothetical protein